MAGILLGQRKNAMGRFLPFFSAGSNVEASTDTYIDIHIFKFIDFAEMST